MSTKVVIVALVASFAVTGAASPQDPSPDTTSPERASLSHVVEVDAADPLLAYRWNNGPEIEASRTPGTVTLPYGEAGPGAGESLYLPFHDGAAIPVGRSGAMVDAKGAEPAGGLFGDGMRLIDGASTLRLARRDGDIPLAQWSLEFWIKPEKPTDVVTIAQAPGVFEMITGPKAVVRAKFASDPPLQLWGKADLVYGEWNHIGLTLDGPELPQARLVVNGKPAGRKIGAIGAASEVVIGGLAGVLDEVRFGDIPAASIAFVERWEGTIAPGAHELTLRYADREETVEVWHDVLTEPVISGDLWEQGSVEHAGVREGGLRWLPGHWTRYETNEPPLPRTTHPTIHVGENRVFLYGGETRDSHVGGMVNTDDTWIFHTETGRWERSRSELAPPPSCHQSGAYSPDHGVVFYAGGQLNEGEKYERYDQIWLYHVDADRWEQRHPEGDTLPQLSDGAALYHPVEKQFVLYGGGNRVFFYDPTTNVLTAKTAKAVAAATGEEIGYVPGGSPMAAYDPERNHFVFFGGALGPLDQRIWSRFTSYLDYETLTYKVFQTNPAPPGRVRGGFAYDSNRKRFVLFGGVLDQNSTRMRDLWIFDPVTEVWTELDCSNRPSRRGGFYDMAYDPDLDRFILLCGRHSKLRFLNDAWALHLDEAAEGIARYRFDRASFAAASAFFAEWTAPEGTSVALAFRGSPDGAAWGEWRDTATAAATADARFVEVELRLRAAGFDVAPVVHQMGFADGDVPETERALVSFSVTPLAE